MNYLKNQKLNRFIRRAEKLCKPEKVVLIDGSKELYDSLLKQAVSTGEMIPLNEQKLPNWLPPPAPQSTTSPASRAGRLFAATNARTQVHQQWWRRQGVFSA